MLRWATRQLSFITFTFGEYCLGLQTCGAAVSCSLILTIILDLSQASILITIAGFIVQKVHQLYKIDTGDKLDTRQRKTAETIKNHNLSDNLKFGTRCT